MAASFSTPRGMKTFFIIWSGQIISIIGSGLTGFALAVWIFDQTGRAAPFVLTMLFGNLPRVVLAPIGGSLADRWNRRKIMILADTGSALVTLVTVPLVFSGQLQVWHIYVLAAAGATFAAFQEPAYTASIAMIVPKKDLARANGLVQMGQAIEMLVSPLLAGLLFVSVGLKGIILIDFVTYFFAVGALLLVRIPQPEAPAQEAMGQRGKLLSDMRFGWRYLRARPGLFGLLLYFALVNFALNAAGVLTGPMVLAFSTASTLGFVQTLSGAAMLGGSILVSTWVGPKRRINGVVGSITLGTLGFMLAGLRPLAFSVAAGMFVLLLCMPFGSAYSQAIWQTKVAPGVQGRVFAIRAMIARSTLPLAYLSAATLADYVFEPLMREGGVLANTVLGDLLGTGAGRGIGLMFVISGVTLLCASALTYANPRVRLVEEELPDAIPEAPPDRAPSETEPGAQEPLPVPTPQT